MTINNFSKINNGIYCYRLEQPIGCLFLIPCSKKETDVIRTFFWLWEKNRSWFDIFLNEKISIVVPSKLLHTEIETRYYRSFFFLELETNVSNSFHRI
jgi:hypothetical protein